MTFEDSAVVLPLTAVGATMADLVGGKAANLGEMLAAGFDVPGGFCVTTTAYREFRPDDPAFGELESCPADDVTRLAELSAKVRRLVLAAPVPSSVESAVRLACQRLSAGGPVAVRSSSTAEDRPDASFAGQYDTFLDVCGADAVLVAVRQCWASLWSERATRYRAAHDVGRRGPAIAVVVQHMVDAECAGVLHTANPVTGNRAETVVEAAPGLGEAVVSGTVTPDHYRLTADGDVADGDVADGAGTGCLSAARLGELQRLGRSLERYFGAPQDVEWAIGHDGRLRLTQSRPITTLFPIPVHAGHDVRAYSSVNIYQGLDRPFTPMGSYLVRKRQEGMRQYLVAVGFSAEVTDVDGWLYWDITDSVRHAAKRPKVVSFMNNLTAPAGQVVEQLGSDPRFPEVPGSSAEAVPGPGRHRWERVVPALLWPSAARARVVRAAEGKLRGFAGPVEATAQERLSFVEDVHRDVCQIEANLPRGANSARTVVSGYVARLLAGYADPAEIAAVYRGIPHNPTTEMDLVLWQLAVAVRRDPALCAQLLETDAGQLARRQLSGELPSVVQDGIREFLAAYGCRTTAEIDFGVPRWSDDPAPVFVMLANFLRATGDDQDAGKRFAAAAVAAEAKIGELTGRLPRSRAPRAWLARFLLRRTRQLCGLREFPKLCLMRGFALLRRQLLLVGAEIAGAGRLAKAGDVLFLDLPEVRKALAGEDFRDLVTERRAVYERECRRPRVPAVILSDGTVPQPDRASAEAALTGLAAAAGVATGPARVVHDPDGARVEPGEILVAATTDPGWTPLFLTAAALVTETGGMVSHGTTVAREHGIPAVVGVGDATRRIRTGQRITVDGSAGTVTPDDPG
ncbi:PEP-utilizing enzyme [Amycolatopsis sp. NBC_00345]|uniref:PEP/pyruvate-binding domain-containing protein n=1 Tax=Amycolatopsis sp. NBC_00345 TaxID=2975955 RepID=UPI002E261B68